MSAVVDASRYNVVMNADTEEVVCVYAPGGRVMTWKEVDDALNRLVQSEKTAPDTFTPVAEQIEKDNEDGR